MPKPNLFQLKETPVRVESRTFTSIYQPGTEFPFRLRGCEEVHQQDVLDAGVSLIEKHVTGNEAKHLKASPVAIPGHQAVLLSRGQCRVIAMVLALQCPEDEADVYALAELAYMARAAKDAFDQLAEWALDLFSFPYAAPQPAENPNGDPGNGTGASITA